MNASPIVKWVGGKTKLLPELIARMPKTFGRYYEPFMGGAALFFKIEAERAVLNDLNRDLAHTYTVITNEAEAVIEHLRWFKSWHSAEVYYATRERWNAGNITPHAHRAAAFVYLNKTCYNGLWRVNKAGKFNVPMGRYVDPPICVPDALRAAQVVLARANVRTMDYRAAVDDARMGDFLYFDPPYDPVSKTSNFTSYAADGFGKADQCGLANLASALVERGCKVMLSNNDTPLIRALYKDFRIDTVKCTRSINSNATKRGEVNEVIITGGYER